MSDHCEMDRATFAAMTESTHADWQKIATAANAFNGELANRVLAHLQMLKGDCGGFSVDRLEHSLQAASLAYRDRMDEEYVVCALLHDMGDILASTNHAELAATILKPFVSEENWWLLQHHGIFQGYYFFHHLGLDRNMREQFRGHANFERTALFCERPIKMRSTRPTPPCRWNSSCPWCSGSWPVPSGQSICARNGMGPTPRSCCRPRSLQA